MKSLIRLLVLMTALLLVSCSGPHSGLAVLFDYHATNKAAMLDAFFKLDAWLRTKGFQTAGEPDGTGIVGLRPGEFWYRGSYNGSAPFGLSVTVVPNALQIVGNYFTSAKTKSEEEILRRKAEDFSKQARVFAATLPTQ